MNTYDLLDYLRPIWNTDTVYNETVMFLGENDIAPLLYAPAEILSVKNYRLDKTLREGADYIVNDGKIARVAGGDIPFYNPRDYYVTDKGKYGIEVREDILRRYGFCGKRYLAYGEEDTFTRNQIAVSYKTEAAWHGGIPQDKQHRFPVFNVKLRSGESMSFTFYGDSITAGCNSSGTPMGGNIPPFMPTFAELITEFLQVQFGARITMNNVSQGGWNTYEGFDAFDERVLPTRPDVLLLGFGMNDLDTPLSDYESMYREMICKVRAQNPCCEIILLATMWPNPDSTWVRNQMRTLSVLLKLEREFDFVAVADMMTMHRDVLQIKRYRDATANNINHPNDFLARIYAQVILKTILGDCYERIYEEKHGGVSG